MAARGWSLSELQKLQPVQQQRRWLAVKRDLLKSPSLPFVLIGLSMLAYIAIVWQWL